MLAIALGAAVRAASSVTDHSFEAKQRVLASWVAQNRLAENIALRTWPEAGEKRGKAEQAGKTWHWHETVTDTPNEGFRRIEIRVRADVDADYVITRLVGYLAKPRPRGSSIAPTTPGAPGNSQTAPTAPGNPQTPTAPGNSQTPTAPGNLQTPTAPGNSQVNR